MFSTISQIAGALANIILDWVFIYPLKMGAAGAAWATVIGQFVSMGLAMFFHYAKNREIHGKTSCEYLLVSCQNAERMHSCSVDLVLDRANNAAGLTQRSLHKIRKTVLSRLDMSRNFTLERIREIAGHSWESITLYTNYFYTIDGLDGISKCKTFEEVVEFQMPDFGKINKLNKPLVFQRAV